MKRTSFALIIFLFLISFNPMTQAQEVLDRVVAVVGDEIILESEFKTQMQLYAEQYRQELGIIDQKELQSFILEQMIKDKLIITQAEKDTTIEVTSEQIEGALDEQMKRLRTQFATEEQFQQQLKKEGIVEKDLRRRYKKAIKSQLLKDQLIRSKLSKVSVSNKEVRDFYWAYKDSIPQQPEGVRLAHILLLIQPEEKTIEKLKDKAKSILEEIKEGKSFSEMAKKYSDDPSSARGGDLGYFKRGDMVLPFERAAFALELGEISDIVQTQFGFHIIKLEDKRGDMVKARHILIMLKSSTEDTARVLNLAQQIYSKIEADTDFADLAKSYSSDEESKKIGGDLGWYPIQSLSLEFKQAIQGLKVGQTSQPLLTQFGIHLLRVSDRKEGKRLSLEEDWDTLKEMVKREKASQEIDKWIDDLKEKTYVEIKL